MKSIGIIAACFLLFAIFAFALNQTEAISFPENKVVLSAQDELEEVELITAPVLQEDVVFPKLTAQAVLVVDLDTNIPLFEKDADNSRLPASTTKIITALVAMDNYPPEKVLVVDSVNIEGQKMKLVPGERITVENLLYGLLVFSANDAAEVLANNYQGGRDVFVEAMNIKAMPQLEIDDKSISFDISMLMFSESLFHIGTMLKLDYEGYMPIDTILTAWIPRDLILTYNDESKPDFIDYILKLYDILHTISAIIDTID